MKHFFVLIACIALFSCGKKEKEKDPAPEELSIRACLKQGQYCYVPKPGFGFVENFCTDDGGVIVLFCPENPVLKCDTDSMTVSLYYAEAKNQTCADVGQPL